MSCKSGVKQVTVSNYFRDRQSGETLYAWIHRNGGKFPALPLFPVATRVEGDRRRGVITWLPLGHKVWSELLGCTDAVSHIQVELDRPDVVTYELFLRHGRPGLWTVRLCACAEVIAHHADAGPPCRNLGEHNCPLLKLRKKRT